MKSTTEQTFSLFMSSSDKIHHPTEQRKEKGGNETKYGMETSVTFESTATQYNRNNAIIKQIS